MKSIYARNFMATAAMVFVCFLVVSLSFVGLGRSYVIREYRQNMEISAREVSRTAYAIAKTDSLNSWILSHFIYSCIRYHISITSFRLVYSS